ncbi:MAG: STAS domain-containing protein [Acidimicrobiales bacterium]
MTTVPDRRPASPDFASTPLPSAPPGAAVCLQEIPPAGRGGGSRTGEAAVIRITGEADLAVVEPLQACIDRALGRSGSRRLVVDLADTTYLDSSAIGVFVRAQRRIDPSGAAKGGCGIVLERPTPAVYRVLELTGVTQFLDVRP